MHTLTAPTKVAQDQSLNHCWGAALYSWMLATGRKGSFSKPVTNYRDVIGKYSDLEDDGVSEQKLTGDVKKDFDMSSSGGTWDLSAVGIENILRYAGYLLLVYKSGYQSSHTLVVYAVGDGKFKCMDPWYGQLKEYPLSDFNGKQPPMPKLMMFPKT